VEISSNFGWTICRTPCARVVVASFEPEPLGGENSTTT
jgi:hypothetical protein